MDIPDQFQQIAVGIDQQGFIPPLKGMTDSLLLCVEVPSVSKTDVLDDFGKGNVAHLDDQVEMVRHQAKDMDSMSEPLNTFLNQQI